ETYHPENRNSADIVQAAPDDKMSVLQPTMLHHPDSTAHPDTLLTSKTRDTTLLDIEGGRYYDDSLPPPPPQSYRRNTSDSRADTSFFNSFENVLSRLAASIESNTRATQLAMDRAEESKTSPSLEYSQ